MSNHARPRRRRGPRQISALQYALALAALAYVLHYGAVIFLSNLAIPA